MKAELSVFGMITLEPETEDEKNFINYWATKKYTIEPKIRFDEEGSAYVYLSEKMPDRGVTSETVADWVKLKEEQETNNNE